MNLLAERQKDAIEIRETHPDQIPVSLSQLNDSCFSAFVHRVCVLRRVAITNVDQITAYKLTLYCVFYAEPVTYVAVTHSACSVLASHC